MINVKKIILLGVAAAAFVGFGAANAYAGWRSNRANSECPQDCVYQGPYCNADNSVCMGPYCNTDNNVCGDPDCIRIPAGPDGAKQEAAVTDIASIQGEAISKAESGQESVTNDRSAVQEAAIPDAEPVQELQVLSPAVGDQMISSTNDNPQPVYNEPYCDACGGICCNSCENGYCSECREPYHNACGRRYCGICGGEYCDPENCRNGVCGDQNGCMNGNGYRGGYHHNDKHHSWRGGNGNHCRR